MVLRLLTACWLFTACNAILVPDYSQKRVEWKKCPPFLEPNTSSPLQCGYLDVPLDWDNPSHTEPITIGFVKIPARDQKNRKGYLFYNPGGPGVLSSQSLNQSLTDGLIRPEILDRFDVIGMDLRGTGLSEPIECSRSLYNMRQPLFTTEKEAHQILIARNRAFYQSCLDMSSRPLVNYMDTVSIVKDYEAIRQALGGEKISYLGQSYGTLLGSQYAELFPTVFNAIVLDGVVSNSLSETAIFTIGAATIDASLDQFFAWCERQNSTICPLAHQNNSPKTIWTDLLARAEKTPLPAPRCTQSGVDCASLNVTDQQIRQSALSSLYSPAVGLKSLAEGLYNATFLNDASSFAHVFISNQTSAYQASNFFAVITISCLDTAHSTSLNLMRLKAQIATSQSPLLNGASAQYNLFQRLCAGFPVSNRNPPHKIDIPRTQELPTIIIVNTLYDPATPLAFAANLQQEIGEDRTRLVVRKALGHTTWLLDAGTGDGDTVAVINEYLLHGTLPDQEAEYLS